MQRILRFFLCALALVYTSSQAQPSLENSLTLPSVVNGSTTTASDGYGLHFVKVESDGQLKHYLVGNDGVELTNYRGTVSTTGTFPVLNAYQGKLRVVFNIGAELKVYQSTDGGVNWYQINTPFTFGEGTIHNIDASTDGYGTHIVWQDRDDFTSNPRVFYRRWSDITPEWKDYKNVSDLSSSPGHKKPKVATSASEAHVAFLGNGGVQLTSRDLNLSTGQWDGSYAIASGNNSYGETISTATIGSTLYAIIHQAVGSALSPAYDIYFAYRDVTGAWQVDALALTKKHGTAQGYRDAITATVGGVAKLYYLNTCFTDQFVACNVGQGGVQLWIFTPGSGWANEGISSPAYYVDNGILSASQFGVYATWGEIPNTAQFMCRKPFAITGTIAERTLLTGNNWVSGQAAQFDWPFVVDAMSNSLTTVFDNSWLTVRGTLNAQAASQFKFGQSGRLIMYGPLNTNGTASQPAVFTHLGPYYWTGITIATGVALSQMNYCSINRASTGISASYSKLNIANSTISNCITGLNLFGMTGVKHYCNLTNSTLTGCGFGARIETSDKVVFTSNQFNGNTGTGVVVALASSPRFYFNEFNSNSYGVSVFDQSSPRFGDYIVGDKGGNTLYNNSITPLIVRGSNPFLGLVTSGAIMAGLNCFNALGSCYIDAQAQNGIKSSVYAQKCFWTDVPPISTKFCVSGGSEISYDSWLSSCNPNQWAPIKIGGGSTPYSLDDERLTRARAMRGRRNYAAAAALYATLVEQRQDGDLAQVAVAELRDTYNDYASYERNGMHRGTMRRYLQTQMRNHPSAAIKRAAKNLNAIELMQDENFAVASSEYNQLLASASTGDERRAAVYGLFNISALGTGDRALAAQYLARLRRDWPNDAETKNAALRFASMPEGRGFTKPGSGDELEPANSTAPSTFALEQNYPNPFNPTTTIRFAVPQNEHVTLKVFDLLGREVATLVNEARNAGSYNETFDASKLSSGVYIYRLRAGNFTATKKFTLMKQVFE